MAIIDITDKNKQEVLEASEPILVDFWATWCGPCRMLSPILDEIANDLDGKINIYKVEVEDNRELAEHFDIMSVPTLAIIKNGEIVESVSGFQPKPQIEQIIERHINV